MNAVGDPGRQYLNQVIKVNSICIGTNCIVVGYNEKNAILLSDISLEVSQNPESNNEEMFKSDIL